MYLFDNLKMNLFKYQINKHQNLKTCFKHLVN